MRILKKYHTLFFRKQGKMSQNLSSAAVVIGALRVNKPLSAKVTIFQVKNQYSIFFMSIYHVKNILLGKTNIK